MDKGRSKRKKGKRRSRKNEGKICSNMEGLGGHYAKLNKSDRERQMLLLSLRCRILKKYNKVVNIPKKDTDSQI